MGIADDIINTAQLARVATLAAEFGEHAACQKMSNDPLKHSDLMNMLRGLLPEDPIFKALCAGFRTGYKRAA